MNEFGRAIKKYRQDNHLTQKELGEMIHYTESAISYWERGERTPDVEAIRSILFKLNLPFDRTMDPLSFVSSDDLAVIVQRPEYDIRQFVRVLFYHIGYALFWIIIVLVITEKKMIFPYFVVCSFFLLIFYFLFFVVRKNKKKTYLIPHQKKIFLISTQDISDFRRTRKQLLLTNLVFLFFGNAFVLLTYAIVSTSNTEPYLIYVSPFYFLLYLGISIYFIINEIRNPTSNNEIPLRNFRADFTILVAKVWIILHDLLYVYLYAYTIISWTVLSISARLTLFLISPLFMVFSHAYYVEWIRRVSLFKLVTK